MFDSSYNFRYCNSSKIKKGQYDVREHVLTFNCNLGLRYIVKVEEYYHSLYAIKFYLKIHANSKRKFNLITGNQTPLPVIGTCIEIMKYFIAKNPFASFAFIGSNSVNENRENTKRFRIYKQLMENIFSPLNFKHLSFLRESAYILINKDNSEPNLLPLYENMFREIYLVEL